MLLLADRGFFSYALWRKAIGTGADLLWRVRTDRARPQARAPAGPRTTGPGWRTCAARPRPRPAVAADAGPRDRLPHRRRPRDTRPATGCSPRSSTRPRPPRPSWPPPTHQRWEIELAFDELKTHQRGPRTVLRSKSPDLVLQEIWGHLCCHYAIRSLMADAAAARRPRPRPGQLRRRAADHPATIAQRALFPPDQHGTAEPHWQAFLRRLLDRLNPARRPRASPARHQTQDAQMARQTRPPRPLAPTRAPPHYTIHRTLTERYWR